MTLIYRTVMLLYSKFWPQGTLGPDINCPSSHAICPCPRWLQPLPCPGAGAVMCLPLAGSRPVYLLGWYSTAATNAAPCPLPSFTMIIVVCKKKPSPCHWWYKIYQYAFFWNSLFWLTEKHSIKISISQRIIKSCFKNGWYCMAKGNISKNINCTKLRQIWFTIDLLASSDFHWQNT